LPHAALQFEEGAQPYGLQDGAGMFVADLAGTNCIVTVSAAEASVLQVELCYWARAAWTDEARARFPIASEAGAYPLQCDAFEYSLKRDLPQCLLVKRQVFSGTDNGHQPRRCGANATALEILCGGRDRQYPDAVIAQQLPLAPIA
jgi:hypothetical protein